LEIKPFMEFQLNKVIRVGGWGPNTKGLVSLKDTTELRHTLFHERAQQKGNCL
jgi:hypothetical protein